MSDKEDKEELPGVGLRWLAMILSFLAAFPQRPTSVTQHRESTTVLESQREGGGHAPAWRVSFQETNGNPAFFVKKKKKKLKWRLSSRYNGKDYILMIMLGISFHSLLMREPLVQRKSEKKVSLLEIKGC